MDSLYSSSSESKDVADIAQQSTMVSWNNITMFRAVQFFFNAQLRTARSWILSRMSNHAVRRSWPMKVIRSRPTMHMHRNVTVTVFINPFTRLYPYRAVITTNKRIRTGSEQVTARRSTARRQAPMAPHDSASVLVGQPPSQYRKNEYGVSPITVRG